MSNEILLSLRDTRSCLCRSYNVRTNLSALPENNFLSFLSIKSKSKCVQNQVRLYTRAYLCEVHSMQNWFSLNLGFQLAKRFSRCLLVCMQLYNFIKTTFRTLDCVFFFIFFFFRGFLNLMSICPLENGHNPVILVIILFHQNSYLSVVMESSSSYTPSYCVFLTVKVQRRSGSTLLRIFLMVLAWVTTSSSCRFSSFGTKLIITQTGAKRITCRYQLFVIRMPTISNLHF